MIQNEAGDEWMFQGDNTRNEFCEWLFTKEHEGCIVLAHNFQGYDGYFIQQYLHENGVIPEVIMRGAKILTMYVPMLKIKLIDSLSFIPMRLADFPKTFGLNELGKRIFPSPLQPEGKPELCCTPTTESLLPSQRNESSRERDVFEMASRIEGEQLCVQFPRRNLELLSIRCGYPSTLLP